MNPSHDDLAYQAALAQRGAFLEYDMIGMDYYYADQQAQSPSDEENARAIRALIDKGFGDRVLMSQDVFLKIMLTRFGGFGYGYILKHFVPRLKRHGIDQAAIDLMLRDQPRAGLQGGLTPWAFTARPICRGSRACRRQSVPRHDARGGALPRAGRDAGGRRERGGARRQGAQPGGRGRPRGGRRVAARRGGARTTRRGSPPRWPARAG